MVKIQNINSSAVKGVFLCPKTLLFLCANDQEESILDYEANDKAHMTKLRALVTMSLFKKSISVTPDTMVAFDKLVFKYNQMGKLSGDNREKASLIKQVFKQREKAFSNKQHTEIAGQITQFLKNLKNVLEFNSTGETINNPNNNNPLEIKALNTFNKELNLQNINFESDDNQNIINWGDKEDEIIEKAQKAIFKLATTKSKNLSENEIEEINLAIKDKDQLQKKYNLQTPQLATINDMVIASQINGWGIMTVIPEITTILELSKPFFPEQEPKIFSVDKTGINAYISKTKNTKEFNKVLKNAKENKFI